MTTESESPYLTPKETAFFLRLKRRTLDNMRWLGYGPRFRPVLHAAFISSRPKPDMNAATSSLPRYRPAPLPWRPHEAILPGASRF